MNDWRTLCKDNKSRAEHILQKEILTDCEFLVGQESDKAVTIRGHKLILAVASPVFERMFYGSFDGNKSNEIRIPDIKHNIFQMMMDYIYFEKLELTTKEHALNALELYSAANKYMLQTLKGECRSYLLNLNSVLIRDIWRIYEFAVFFEENAVMAKASEWMARGTMNILKDPGLKDANLTTLIALFEKETLQIGSELDLFEGLKKYAIANGYFDTKNNLENKDIASEIGEKKLLREALKKIRFLCMTPEQFQIVDMSGVLTHSEVFSILWNLLIPDNKDRPMPEGFSNSRSQRARYTMQ